MAVFFMSLHYEALKQRANVRCVLIARTNKMIRRFQSAADRIVTIARWDELIGKHEFWVYRVKLKKKNKIITALHQGKRHQIELTVGNITSS